MKLLPLFALFLFSILLRRAQGKHVRGEIESYGTSQFYYLAKFGCDLGICQWRFRFRVNPSKSQKKILSSLGSNKEELHGKYTVKMYLDEDWVNMDASSQKGCSFVNLARASEPVDIAVNTGEWSGWAAGAMHQSVRPHLWYYVLEDCGLKTQSHFRSVLGMSDSETPEKSRWGPMFDLRVEYEGIIVQETGSHHSYETLRTVKWVVLQLFLYAAVAVLLYIEEHKLLKSMGCLHPYIQALNAIVVLQAASAMMHIIHLVSYQANGRGFFIIEAFSQFIALLAQIGISSILSFIALGYSLEMGNAMATPALALALPVTLVLTAFQAVIFFLNRLVGDQRHSYHDMDGWLGWVVIALRLAHYGGFVAGWQNTYRQATSLHREILASFLRQLFCASTLYFLGLPVIFLFTEVFAPYLQHTFLSQTTFLVQLSAISWLGTLFLRNEVFSKVSEMGRSFLPGGYLEMHGYHRSE